MSNCGRNDTCSAVSLAMVPSRTSFVKYFSIMIMPCSSPVSRTLSSMNDFPSLISAATAGVFCKISTAGMTGAPGDVVGTSRCATTTRSIAASCERTCGCWCGGNTSMMRLIASVVELVWSVEKTRCPVSAAVSAAEIVSKSRISPTSTTSGSWRSDARSAFAQLVVSSVNSR